MKSNNRILAMSAAIMAAMASVASATTTYTQGDLLLGFRATTGTGATTNYVVNLGQSTLYTSAVGTSTINVGNIGADLSNIYGSTWYTSVGTDVAWGVVGSASNLVTVGADAAATVYYTLPGAATTLNNTTQKIASGAMVTFESNTNGYSTTFNSASLNSAFAQVIDASNANSWSANLNNGTTTTIDFKLFPEIEGSPSTVLNLYRDGSTTGTGNQSVQLGSFSLSPTGALTFTSVNPVPEPSAALLGGLGTLLLFTRRRRNA